MRSLSKYMATAIALAGVFCASSMTVAAKPPAASSEPVVKKISNYHVVKTIPIPGDTGWDYIAVDSEGRRIYVSHGTHVVVVDADSFAIVGDIPDTNGVHGIALAPKLNRGFTSNGRANTVTIFDLKTLQTLGTVQTGTNPDAIVYDEVSGRVFTMNGRSQNSTAINAADGSVAGTLALEGKPEFAVADGKGSIFVNLEDKSQIVQFDAQKLTITNRWPLAPCEEPSGLAMDREHRRLFSVCDNKVMAVMDANNGKVVATPAIGEGPDAVVFDPAQKLVISSNGETGTLTVVHEISPKEFFVVENPKTKVSARTIGLDLKTQRLFLPSADVAPKEGGEHHAKSKPGSFALLVMEP